MIWGIVVPLLAAVVGLIAISVVLKSHLDEARERRRIELHRWAMDEERAILKAAAMTPLQFKGYRTPESKR